MTQSYYTEKLLSVYVRSVQEERVQYGRAISQGNNLSHDTRQDDATAQKGLKQIQTHYATDVNSRAILDISPDEPKLSISIIANQTLIISAAPR